MPSADPPLISRPLAPSFPRLSTPFRSAKSECRIRRRRTAHGPCVAQSSRHTPCAVRRPAPRFLTRSPPRFLASPPPFRSAKSTAPNKTRADGIRSVPATLSLRPSLPRSARVLTRPPWPLRRRPRTLRRRWLCMCLCWGFSISPTTSPTEEDVHEPMEQRPDSCPQSPEEERAKKTPGIAAVPRTMARQPVTRLGVSQENFRRRPLSSSARWLATPPMARETAGRAASGFLAAWGRLSGGGVAGSTLSAIAGIPPLGTISPEPSARDPASPVSSSQFPIRSSIPSGPAADDSITVAVGVAVVRTCRLSRRHQ